MLILGHAGITLGAAVALEALHAHRRSSVAGTATGMAPQPADLLVSLSRRVDLRLLLVGSLLPDLIDKPVGLLLFPDLFGTGRLFCHTLLFTVLLAVGGAWLYHSRRKTGLLVLSFGCAMHLALDRMWQSPETLLWPAMGVVLQGQTHDYWLRTIFLDLLSRPEAYLPEIAGAMLLAPLSVVIARRGSLPRFLRTGILD